MEQFDFTAWSLYTGPSYLKTIINDPNCPWVVGQWDGVNANTTAPEIKKDIDQRIALVVEGFKKALPSWKTYNRHFAIPEFFFHCKQGPYPNLKIDSELYPFEYIVKQLKQQLGACVPNDNNYYNVVIGSVLTSNVADYEALLNSPAVKEREAQLNAILPKGVGKSLKAFGHAAWHRSFRSNLVSMNADLNALNNFMLMARGNPLCTVRNRGAFFQFNNPLIPGGEVFVYEKQYESTVDLTMGMFDASGKISASGMITEWIGNYPSYSILSGDKQTSPYMNFARFTPSFAGFSDYGVEICLDHRLQRLRRTVDMSMVNGAAADNYPLFKQLIPSGGMQILDYAVAAARNSIIFNADGCDKIYYVYTDPNSYILDGKAGKFKGITCGVYTQSVQSKWQARDGNTYYSHSQLAFTTNDSTVAGFNNALGLNNPMARTYDGTPEAPYNARTDSFSPVIIPMPAESQLFAGTTGELHYYEPQ